MLTCLRLKDNKIGEIPSDLILALGNFDGVHLGHKALLDKVKELAKEHYIPSAVFFFNDNSHAKINQKDHFCITTKEEKLLLLKEYQIEYAICCDFDEMCNLSAEDFLSFLNDQLHAKIAVCGFNYKFGKNALGDANYLQKHFKNPIFVVDAKKVENQVVSSSFIRELLLSGRMEEANQMLDCPFFLLSKVEKGFQLGQKMNFPTINQVFDENKIIPKFGVYAVKVEFDNKSYYGMANVGKHPTINSLETPICETNIFDFQGDLYNKTIKTSFISFIREEQKFENVDDLKKQLSKDKETIKELFSI